MGETITKPKISPTKPKKNPGKIKIKKPKVMPKPKA